MKSSDPLGQRAAAFFRIGLPAFLGIAFLALSQPTVRAQTLQELAAEMQAMKARITELETKLAVAEAKVANVEQTAAVAEQAAAGAEQSASAAVQVAASGGSPMLTDEKGVVVDGDVPLPVIPQPQDGWWNRTSIGGYGEMHLNLGDKEQIDYHRWVLLIDHEFNDRMRLITETELEHSIAGDGKPGELELEQAYLEFDFGNDYAFRAGLFLLPLGIINEYHEPTTFFGTERNFVETEIIPSTWWEGGIGLNKKFDNGLALDLSGHSALDVASDGDSAFRIRSGREKVGEAPADAWASTFNAEYKGIPGFGMGGSVQYQSDITQTTSSENNNAWLSEAHIDYQWGGFGLRGVYSRWDIKGATPSRLGLDQQNGYYIEPSYSFNTGIGEFGIFGRWSRVDAEKIDSHVYDVGINYWPHENIVFKADYTKIADQDEDDFINFGLGFVF